MKTVPRLALVACVLLSVALGAHDLTESSALLTVRDSGIVELRLTIPYDDVLRRATMPNQPLPVFLAAFSSAADRAVAGALTTLHEHVHRETRVMADGRPVPLTAWEWPDVGLVRTGFRRAAMMATVGTHEHMERLTVTARGQLAGGAPIRQVQIQLPEQLGPALVTVIHPEERWIKGGALSAPMPIR